MQKLSAKRYPVAFPVRLVPTKIPSSVGGVSGNISETGMLVHAAAPLPPGTRVRLEPLLMGGTAEVVWARGGGPDAATGGDANIGLKFVGLTHHDRETISALIRSLSRARPADADY